MAWCRENLSYILWGLEAEKLTVSVASKSDSSAVERLWNVTTITTKRMFWPQIPWFEILRHILIRRLMWCWNGPSQHAEPRFVVTSPISTVSSFSQFFCCIKALAVHWISRLYLTGVDCGENVSMFWRCFEFNMSFCDKWWATIDDENVEVF